MDKFESALKNASKKEEEEGAPVALEGQEKKEEPVIEKEAPVTGDLSADKVFEFLDNNVSQTWQYLSKIANKEVKSLEDLKEVKEVIKEVVKEPELPDDVRKYWDYNKTTGRGFEDFLKAGKDWNTESKEAVVMEYIRQTEQLDGDILKESFDLMFVPDEGATEREERLAKLNFEKSYKQALGYFKEQQKQFALPSELQSSQRQAEAKSQEDVRRFQEGMLNAVKAVRSIDIDDFSFKLEDEGKTGEQYSSLENILAPFKKGDSFDYAALFKTLEAGRKMETIAKSYAEHFKNKMTEADLAKLTNRQKLTSSPISDVMLDGARVAQEFKNRF
jgi:hypothetical protein